MKIVLLLSDNISNRYLIKKFRENFNVAGIVIQEELPESLRKKIGRIGGLTNILNHIFFRLLTQRSHEEGRCLEKKYFSDKGKPYPLPDDIPFLSVKNINDVKVRDFILKLRPDLVACFGTQLLRDPILSLYPVPINKGIINMHTGLSPYIRGGSATFWALYSGKPQHVGATVHYIDNNIDRGDIILSARPENIEVDDTDFTLDVKVRSLGIDLYIKAVRQIEKGINKRVRQWPEGQLFAAKTNYKKTLKMVYELRKKLKKERLLEKYLRNKQQYDQGVTIIDENPIF